MVELFEKHNPLDSLQARQVELLCVEQNLTVLRDTIQRRDDVALKSEDDDILVVEYNTGSLQIYDKSTALLVATISPEDAEEGTIVVYLYQFGELRDYISSLEVPAIVVKFDASLRPVSANWGSVISSPVRGGGSFIYLMNGAKLPPVGSKMIKAKDVAEAIKGHVFGE